MRENDDDAPVTEPHGSLADGLGETDSGGYESSGDPYGDVDFDDTYGDDEGSGGADDTYGDGTDGTGTDDTYDTEDTYGDGSYGDGDGTEDTYDTDDESDVDDGDVTVDDAPDDGLDDLVAHDNSPLEGIGFLIDEVREALFGDDDAGAASPFDTDPVDLETDTDLDLTGDGVVDRADLHEAASSLDFDVNGGHHHVHHHDDGVMDA